MKNITLKSLELNNFKGIRHVLFDSLDKKENYFHGKNKAGKTTLFNAFLWVLFGKDLNNRKDYEIKPLDENNNPVKDVTTEVNITLLVDNDEITISRIYKEKWSKVRGSEEVIFKGHETELLFNSVPVSLKEFNQKISEIIPEDVFKLITNPLYFESLDWKEKREVLVSIAGDITDQELFDSDKDFKTLELKLHNKTLEEYSIQLKSSIDKSKKEKEDIPSRIDEANRSKIDDVDFDLIEKEINKNKSLLSEIDSQIENSGKSVQNIIDSNTGIQEKIQLLNSEKSDIEINLRTKAKQECFIDTSNIDVLKSKLQNTETMLANSNNYLSSLKQNISSYQNSINTLEAEKAGLIEKYNTENSKLFDADKYSCTCPNCQTKFVYNDEPEKEFNIDKSQKLSKIINQGNSIKSSIEEYQSKIGKIEIEINEKELEIQNLSSQINSLKEQIESETNNLQSPKNEEEVYLSLVNNNAQISKLNIEISTLQASIKEVKQADVSELKEQKKAIQLEIDSLTEKKASKTVNDNLDKRINELSVREKDLSQIISNLEKEQFIIERFKKVKSESLEQRVNDLFKVVKFKLFEKQINGGIKPTCVTLVDGVPFNSVNTASQINAGLDVINTLCTSNQVTAPIFLDNRESCTEIIPTDSQIINLVVDPNQETLTLINKAI